MAVVRERREGNGERLKSIKVIQANLSMPQSRVSQISAGEGGGDRLLMIHGAVMDRVGEKATGGAAPSARCRGKPLAEA